MVVKVGQIWVDRDRRTMGRRVRVIYVDADNGLVHYNHPTLPSRTPCASRLDRFVRAFRLVEDRPSALRNPHTGERK